MKHGNADRTCRWCKKEFHISVRGIALHQNRCEANPNPEPLPEPKTTPKWQCPACGKTLTEARKHVHICPKPKQAAVRQGKFEAAIETMKRNDRKRERQRYPAPVECPRCHKTPCETPDACGRAIRAAAQHAARLEREAKQLGHRNTN